MVTHLAIPLVETENSLYAPQHSCTSIFCIIVNYYLKGAARLKLGGHESSHIPRPCHTNWELSNATWLFILVLHRGPRPSYSWLAGGKKQLVGKHQQSSKLSQLTSCHLASTPLQTDRLWRTVLCLHPLLIASLPRVQPLISLTQPASSWSGTRFWV